MTAAAAFSDSRCRARRMAAVQATSSGTGSAAQRQSVVLAQHLGRLAVELGETVPDLGKQLGPAQNVERLFEGVQGIRCVWLGRSSGGETDRVISSRSASSAPAGCRFSREVIAA